MPRKTIKPLPPIDPTTLLTKVGVGKSVATYRRKQVIFSQGDPADEVYYVQKVECS
jgi:CRP-like cAMP-binding protein